MSQNSNKVGKITQQISEQAPPLIHEVIDKLTGMNASITYNFENFEVDIPAVQGPEGQYIDRSSVLKDSKFTINGSLKISTELHDRSNKTNEDKA